MKRIITIAAILFISINQIFAQVPQAINFQAIARNSSGDVLSNTDIKIRLTIIDGSFMDNEVYQEVRSLTTNGFGAFSFQIGRDADYVSIGEFSEIEWETGEKFLKIDYNPSNQEDWSLSLGTIELVTVPYSFSAGSVTSIDMSNVSDGDILVYNSLTEKYESKHLSDYSSKWSKTGNHIYYNTGNIGIGTENPGSDLEIVGDGTDDDIIRIKNNDYSRYASYTYSSEQMAIPAFVGFRSRGTIETPENVIADDRITGLYGAVNINGDYKVSSAVEMFTGDNISSTSSPSYIIFGTTPNNSLERQERVRIDSEGNVGIGTSEPKGILDINGEYHFPTVDGSNGQVLLTDGTGNLTWNSIEQNSNLWSENGSEIFFNSANVGIGTNNPGSDLEVVGDGTADDIIRIKNNDYSRFATYGYSNERMAIPAFVGYRSRGTIESPINVAADDRITGFYGAVNINGDYKVSSAVEMFTGDNISPTSSPSYMIFGTTPNNSLVRQERLRIDSEGNVGIGTSNPKGILDINGEYHFPSVDGSNGQVLVTDGTGNLTWSANQGNNNLWSENGNEIYFNSSNVGIGTNNPNSDLEVVGDGTDDDIISIKNNDYSRYASYTYSSEQMAIPAFVGFRSRGTIETPENVIADDRITGLYGAVNINGDYKVSSAVEMFTGDNISSTSSPSYMIFGTTSNNSLIREERVRVDSEGNMGIGTSEPKTKLQVTDGDVYIENIDKGVIMKSPNGQCWRLKVDDTGNIVTNSITCP